MSAHAALPFGGLFIAHLSLLFLDLHGWQRGRGLSPTRHAMAWTWLFLVVHYFHGNVKIIHVSQRCEGVSKIYLIIVTYCMQWKVSILEQSSVVLFLLWLHKSRERTSSIAILELLGQIYVNSNLWCETIFKSTSLNVGILNILQYNQNLTVINPPKLRGLLFIKRL